ncbi:MAG TPA: hypothetical protein VJ783_00485, partial [Pirellulales bacterium]|nr:hypothetical protein [Pirellulales bacterium]
VAFRSAKGRPFAERKSTLSWRRWAAHAARIFSRDPSVTDDHRPRVILCGNPRILDPVCDELLARGCHVWWLYEEFAVRAWWKWRTAGVEQLLCDGPISGGSGQRWESLRSVPPASAVDAARPFAERHGVRTLQLASVSGVTCRGVNLDGAIACWLPEQATKHGARQSGWLDRIDEHLREVRPAVLVLDEDATPFKRAVVGIARRHGARSLVVQHGAPCGPFGFAPLAADEICVWGDSTREQLLDWGVADSRIHVTGWPGLSVCRERTPCRSVRHVDQPPSAGSTTPTSSAKDSRGRLSHTPVAQLPALNVKTNQTPIPPRQSPQFLLLATVPPDDRRPDTVTFHLTTRSHAAMIEMACAAVSRFAGARLTIKLHPRAKNARLFEKLAKRWRQLDIRLIQQGDTASLWSDADCVLSCTSTAGIEAALAGAPVVQLLPAGSGDILPADRWGLIGSARTLEELCRLIDHALAGGWCQTPNGRRDIATETGARAAAAVVDRVLPSTGTPVAGAVACRDRSANQAVLPCQA